MVTHTHQKITTALTKGLFPRVVALPVPMYNTNQQVTSWAQWISHA